MYAGVYRLACGEATLPGLSSTAAQALCARTRFPAACAARYEKRGWTHLVNLPNLLTIFRIFLVPVIIWLIAVGAFSAAFWTFVVAGLTDGLDGYLARRWNERTELGAYLDPLADKTLLVSIYVTLGIVGALPRWLVILVVFRDVLILGGLVLAWLLARPMAARPLLISKATTLAQILFAAIVLGVRGYGLEMPFLQEAAGISVAVLTLLSALAYVAAWMRHMTAEPA